MSVCIDLYGYGFDEQLGVVSMGVEIDVCSFFDFSIKIGGKHIHCLYINFPLLFCDSIHYIFFTISHIFIESFILHKRRYIIPPFSFPAEHRCWQGYTCIVRQPSLSWKVAEKQGMPTKWFCPSATFPG